MLHLILSLAILCAIVWTIRRWKLVATFLAWVIMAPFRGSAAAPAVPVTSSVGGGRPAPRTQGRAASGKAAAGTAYLSAGRRMRSSRSPEQCAALLLKVFDGYRPRKYPELPPLVPAGVRWHAEQAVPTISLSGKDEADHWLLITLAPVQGATEIGIFALEEQPLSVVGHWKGRDQSLTSTGRWPARTVELAPPPVSDEIVASTLTANGFPATSRNLRAMGGHLFNQFLAKAYTFVNGQDGEEAAKRFIAAQRRRADYSSLAGPLRSTMQALGEWNNQVLPYIQDLPLRVRALLLDFADGSGNGGIWAELDPDEDEHED